MKLILTAGLLDLLLLIIFRLNGTPYGIGALILLAAANILFYLVLLAVFLRRTAKLPERKGFLLEFVLLQFFLCTGIFLFKLTDLMIHLNCP